MPKQQRWADVALSDQYAALSDAGKRAAQERYFDTAVAPAIDEAERDIARQTFLERVGGDRQARVTPYPESPSARGASPAAAAGAGLPRSALTDLTDAARGLVDTARRATPVARYVDVARRALLGPTADERRRDEDEKELRNLQDTYELAVKHKMQGT
jgi:hypothetical protein